MRHSGKVISVVENVKLYFHIMSVQCNAVMTGTDKCSCCSVMEEWMAIIPCYRESFTLLILVQFLKKKPEILSVVCEQDFRTALVVITPVFCKFVLHKLDSGLVKWRWVHLYNCFFLWELNALWYTLAALSAFKKRVQRNVYLFCFVLHCLSCTLPIKFAFVVLNNSDPIERSLKIQTIKKTICNYVTGPS